MKLLQNSPSVAVLRRNQSPKEIPTLMSTLLHIDSSPLLEMSVSRALSRYFVAEWKARHANGTVIVRDISLTAIPPLSALWIEASLALPATRTPEQHAVLQLSDMLISELQSADEYVVGVAMHNFSIPSTLKLWIDEITRLGLTFNYICVIWLAPASLHRFRPFPAIALIASCAPPAG